jgi:hypothetical protein
MLSRENNINHVSSIVKKKIHALRKVSSDLDQFEQFNIAHGSIHSVLHYAAGTWLNKGLQDKFIRRLKVPSNATLQIVFGKKRQESRPLVLHSRANMLTPSQMALHIPGSFRQKVLANKFLKVLNTFAINQVSYEEENKCYNSHKRLETKNETFKIF